MSITWHGITSLTYDGEEPIPVPYIEVTHGSWYQKPDMLLKRQKSREHKTFGRSVNGRTNALTWIEQEIERIIVAHNWELPVEVTYHPRIRAQSIAQGTNGLTFGYKGDYGVTEVGLFDPVHNKIPYYSYALPAHLLDILDHDLDFNIQRNRTIAIGLDRPYHKEIRKDYQPVKAALQEFYEDPWSVARRHVTELAHALVMDLVEPKVTTLRYFTGEVPWEEWYDFGPTLYIPDRFARYMPDYHERGITSEEWTLFQKVLAKFRDLGISVSVQQRVGTNTEEREITGVTIDTPRLNIVFAEEGPWGEFDDDERGILEKHSVTLGNEGLTVMCGYLASEERFTRYQARQMKDFIGEMMGEDDPDEPESTTDVLNW